MSTEASQTLSAPPKPAPRVRSVVPVYLLSGLVIFVIIMLAIFLAIVPLFKSISESNEAREFAIADAQMLEVTVADLEVKRDNIIEQYEAIEAFADRYPASARQDDLFRNIQQSGWFSGMNINSVSTEYPQLLDDTGTSGGVITPDMIVIEPAAGEVPSVNGEEGETLAPADDEQTSIDSGTTSYPLGSIPLTLSAADDGTQAFIDIDGNVYVSSPHLGHYAFGGGEEGEYLPRLSLAVALEASEDGLGSYFSSDRTGVGATPWPTIFFPDFTQMPYVNMENPESLGIQGLIDARPALRESSPVVVPEEWDSNNGYIPFAPILRSAWIIDEIHSSPGRAIITDFVSASGGQVTIVGRQFIVRELPPLPQEVFGDIPGVTLPSLVPTPSPSPGNGPATPAPVPTPTTPPAGEEN